MQHPVESLTSVFETLGNILPILQLPLLPPLSHSLKLFGEALGIVRNQEALRLGPLDDEQPDRAGST